MEATIRDGSGAAEMDVGTSPKVGERDYGHDSQEVGGRSVSLEKLVCLTQSSEGTVLEGSLKINVNRTLMLINRSE